MAQYTRELLAPLHARLEAQATQIGRLEERTTTLQAENEHLRVQLAAATAAPATNGVAHPPHDAQAHGQAEAAPEPQQSAPSSEQATRRWWRRAWAWFNGGQVPA
jgi:hypothetical protein